MTRRTRRAGARSQLPSTTRRVTYHQHTQIQRRVPLELLLRVRVDSSLEELACWFGEVFHGAGVGDVTLLSWSSWSSRWTSCVEVEGETIAGVFPRAPRDATLTGITSVVESNKSRTRTRTRTTVASASLCYIPLRLKMVRQLLVVGRPADAASVEQPRLPARRSDAT